MRALAITVCVAALGVAALGCGSGSSKDKPKKTQTVSDAGAGAKKTAVPSDAATPTPPPTMVLAKAPPVPPAPRGLPETPSPKYNPTTANKVMLGKLLFFDTRLSANRNMSCNSCHIPKYGWSDRRPRSRTANGIRNLRHTPTLYNVAYVKAFRWDGAMDSLEAFIRNHWKGQYGTPPANVIKRLRRHREYRAHFARSFANKPIKPNRVVEALSAFVRTIRSGNSAWDRYELDNDETLVSKQAIAGSKLFRDTAQCGLCHPPPHYTDHLFHNKGIGIATQSPDKGRAHVTKNDKDTGAFRTPTLRGIGRTAPYFHDGSSPTLANAVNYSLSGGFHTNNKWLDSKLQPVTLTAGQRADLIEFLKALTP